MPDVTICHNANASKNSSLPHIREDGTWAGINHLRQLSFLVGEFQVLVRGPATYIKWQDVVWKDHVTWR